MKNKLSNSLLFFILFSSVSSLQAQDYLKMLFPVELTKNANSIVRLDETVVEIKRIDAMTYTHKRVVTVFNKKGNQDIDAFLHYSDLQKVKSIEARVYDAKGKEIKKFKKKHFTDISASDGFSLYTDARIYKIDYTPYAYPFTFVFEYEIKQSSTAFLPKWYPITNSLQSVEKSTYEIKNESGAKLNYKLLNQDLYEHIQVDYKDNNIAIEAKLLTAFKNESYNASIFRFVPHAIMSLEQFHLEGIDAEIHNWTEFGQWKSENLLKGRDQISDATAREIEALVQGVESEKEKAKIIYQYVQQKMRYVSVQIGLGGWMPITAKEVDQVKYGDCKGLTNYTKALLKHVGVTANYTLIHNDTNKKDIYEDVVALQGNHVILNLPLEDEEIWLECTSQDYPFGYIGLGNEDRNVVVITEDGGKIKRTPRLTEETNIQHSSAEINLSSDGLMNAQLERTSGGFQYQRRYGYASENSKDLIKSYNKEWSYIRDLNLLDFTFTNRKDEVQFVEHIEVASRKYTKQLGNLMVFPLNVFNQSISKPSKYSDRTTPFAVEHGYRDLDEYQFNLPETYEVDNLPEDVNLNNRFGVYKLSFSHDEKHIYYSRELILKNGYYNKEDYSEFRDFLAQIEQNDQLKAILKPKS